MWIVILNFCLFFLLLGFFFYGIRQWTNLIIDPEDGEEPVKIVDGRFHRLPVWIIIGGLGIISLASDIIKWLGY